MTTRLPKIRVRKTPRGRHLYYATMRAVGPYGWGDTPDEARAKLAEMLTKFGHPAAAAVTAALKLKETGT